MTKYNHFIGVPQSEKTINTFNRLIIFSFINSKSSKKALHSKLGSQLQGTIVIRNYQLQILESLIVQYENTLFRLDYREKLFKGSITSKMFSKSVMGSNKSLMLSIKKQVQDIRSFLKHKSCTNNFKKLLLCNFSFFVVIVLFFFPRMYTAWSILKNRESKKLKIVDL